MANRGSLGGWIPVVKQRGRHSNSNSWSDGRRSSLITLFVDNLPESLAPKNLYDLFSNFGVVKDVFIPYKRRKVTNSRFGFVRYDCSTAASVAEQKANGLWVDDKSLSVRIAAFDKHTEARQRGKHVSTRQPMVRNSSGLAKSSIWNHRTDGRSFAEVIKGDQTKLSSTTTIRVEESGNGWLYESLIMRLKPDHTSVQVKNELIKREELSVLVREGGGRDVFLSFLSKEDLMGKKSMVEGWFHDWCEYITVWSPGMYLQQQRQVWISCFGVPPNLWNSNTFRRIGSLWGEVVFLDGNIGAPNSFRSGRLKIVTVVMEPINTSLNLECKGRIYPVRVLEDQSVEEASFSCKETLSKEPVEAVCSKINGAIHPSQKHKPEEEDGGKAEDMAGASAGSNKGTASGLKAMDELAVGGSWSNTSVVAETIDCVGNSNEAGTCVAESVLPLISLHQRCNHFAQTGVEDQLPPQNLQEWVDCNHASQNRLSVDQAVEGQIITSGFIKSFSQSPPERPGICLEIDLGQNLNGLQPNEARKPDFLTSRPLISGSIVEQPCGAPGMSPQSQAIDTYMQPISNSSISHIKKGKRKATRRNGLKYSLFAGRFSGFASRVGYKGAGSSYGSKTGVKAKSPSVHSSPNHTSDSIHTSSSKGTLHEATATLQVGKILGVDYKGHESEVVKKFMQMEELDKVRMAGGPGIVE